MILDELSRIAESALLDVFGQRVDGVPIEFPETAAFGDFTINCFHLAKSLRKAPPEIATRLAEALAGRAPIRTAGAASGYVNLTVERAALFGAAIPAAVTDARALGANASRAGRRVLVEFSAPNTNKPQHLGHLRNNFLGDAVSRVLENAGARVFRINLVNDRGIHVCKSMLAYERWGAGVTPESLGRKGDHLVGDFYVRFETEFRKEVDAYAAAHGDEFELYYAEHSVDRKGALRSEDAEGVARDLQGGELRQDPARQRRAGDAPPLGERRPRDRRALAEDERLGPRGLRRDLPPARDRVRQRGSSERT
jgi:arginyl-tRNA synthetase